MWKCPHCGAPQAESARCWVCRRSSTTCSTCRHFQRSLAAEVGYCGLDPRRAPLTGLEHRGCWEARPAVVAAESPGSMPPRRRRVPPFRVDPETPPRGFVPVDAVERLRPRESPIQPADERAAAMEITPIAVPDAAEDWTDRRSLFGDAEA